LVFVTALCVTLAGGWSGVWFAGLDDPKTGGILAGLAFFVAVLLTGWKSSRCS
jgi:hypothetical protein